MKSRVCVFLSISVLLFYTPIYASEPPAHSLVAIVVADTLCERNGEGGKADVERLSQFLQTIAQHIKYKLDLSVLPAIPARKNVNA